MARALLSAPSVKERLECPRLPVGARHPRARQRGFTLVEMAIVVVIVGILAVLAVIGYRRLVTSSHMAEANHMVQAIRVAQEAYRSETQQYANISKDIIPPNMYPQTSPTIPPSKTGWGAACPQCNQDWSTLPVHPDGPVMFTYATVAGFPGQTPSATQPTIEGQVLAWPSAASIVDNWYIVAAVGDTDGNGINCTVIGTSWENDIFVDKEGE